MKDTIKTFACFSANPQGHCALQGLTQCKHCMQQEGLHTGTVQLIEVQLIEGSVKTAAWSLSDVPKTIHLADGTVDEQEGA